MRVNDIHRLVIEDGEDFSYRYDPTPHVNPKPQSSERVLVIHAPASASVNGAVGHLKDKPPKNSFLPRSTHLVLGRDGRDVVQLIPFHTGANHAFAFNSKSIAIDLQYPGELTEKGYKFQLKSNFAEDEYILASPLSGSRYGFWATYPKEQLNSLLAIARTLIGKYNITDVLAYDEIMNAAHPGPAFPITQFREKLLGITDRSMVLQETSYNTLLFGQPARDSSLLLKSRIPKGTQVSVINEKDDWYLVSVIDEVEDNPWLVGWVKKRAVRVPTKFIPAVNQKHYLTANKGRRFQEIVPHPNGYRSDVTNPEPKYIIIHFTTGTRMESTISHFKNPSAGVSTHLLIGRDGRVIQFIPFDHIAHHCGYSWWERQTNINNMSIGIELDNAGLLRRGMHGTWLQRKIEIPAKKVKQAVHWKQYKANDPKRYPGWEKFPKVQLDVLLNILKALVKKYPSIEEILGHDDVNLRNRYDPGPLFPMTSFRKKLFERRNPKVTVYKITKETELYGNFKGMLPNTKQSAFDTPLPAKSEVRVIREENDFSLVSVIKSQNPSIKGTGWVQTASLEAPIHKKGKKADEKAKARKRTTIPQLFFKRGENPPTPMLNEGPFKPGTRVRIQQVRGEWTLVVVLDTVKGRKGLEGWMPTEFLTPEVNP
jgi:N-acetylmuramoyl-L-alanine amidase